MRDAGISPTRSRAPLGVSRVTSPTAVAMGHEVMAGQLERQAALAKGAARTLQQLNAKASTVLLQWTGVDHPIHVLTMLPMLYSNGSRS